MCANEIDELQNDISLVKHQILLKILNHLTNDYWKSSFFLHVNSIYMHLNIMLHFTK